MNDVNIVEGISEYFEKIYLFEKWKFIYSCKNFYWLWWILAICKLPDNLKKFNLNIVLMFSRLVLFNMWVEWIRHEIFKNSFIKKINKKKLQLNLKSTSKLLYLITVKSVKKKKKNYFLKSNIIIFSSIKRMLMILFDRNLKKMTENV